MKKFTIALFLMALFAIMMPIAANAQTYVRRYVGRDGRVHYARVNKKPSFYRRHRNASNIAIGTGAGALIGAIAGGKKGALIGTAVGAGGSALYTYKIKPKKRRYYR
jgi:outer membrane lipoprotein SlyB